MSYITDGIRTEIAKDLLAAMLHGLCSASINPLCVTDYRAGVAAAPNLAVQLTDALIKELEAIKNQQEQP